MRAFLASASSILFVSMLSGCGPNAVGEPCAYPGEARDCAAGALCTQDVATMVTSPTDPTWSSYTCRVDCTTSGTCPDGFVCRGVPSREMLRSCQPVSMPATP